jgi:hypothetical protein
MPAPARVLGKNFVEYYVLWDLSSSAVSGHTVDS